VGKQVNLRVFWNNGPWMETEDRMFRFHIGGLVHAEAGWWEADDQLMHGVGGVGPLNDGAAFRRARLHFLGQMYHSVQWTLEVGFENRLPQFFNAYAELPDLPCLGTLRFGHFREPFGMDALTSYNNLTFLERGLVQDPFVPLFNMGMMVFGDLFDERATYATGIFRSNSDNFNAADFGDGNYACTTRLTANPWYLKDCYALHLGTAFSYRVLPQLNALGQPVTSGGARRVAFSSRPEFRVNAPTFISTGVLEADHDCLLGAELGLSTGPFLLQAEYVAAFVESALAPAGKVRDSYFFHGGYVQAGYFLTGEHRPYVRKEGIFGMVRPHENFFMVRGGEDQKGPIYHGLGAWELAFRYSQVDLSSGNVEGGTLRDVALGLNWYLNPNCRVVWNYLLMWRDGPRETGDGLARAFGARFQIEF
jgi:phosphate-selective porin OprO/OprP